MIPKECVHPKWGAVGGVMLVHQRNTGKSVTQTSVGCVCLNIVQGTGALTNGSELLESYGSRSREPDASGFGNSRQRSQTVVLGT